MPKVDPKFNIHSTYRKLNLVNPYRYDIGSSGAYLLDEITPQPFLAYSFRKLNPAYNAMCIRARRVSDDVEQDFGFVNDYLDTGSLVSFSQGGDVRLVKMYNQSGTIQFLNISASQQPYLVTAGVLNEVNEKLGFNSKVWDQRLFTENIATPPSNSCEFNIIQNTTSNYFSTGRTPNGYYGVGQIESSSSSVNSNVGSPINFIDGVQVSPVTRGEVHLKITDGNIHLVSTKNLSLPANTNIQSAYSNGSLPSVDFWFEKVHYPTLTDVERQAVENNVKTYYGI